MAHPWLFESTFEGGTVPGDATEWNGGETDTDSKLSIDHYTKTAALKKVVPWGGIYAAHIDQAIGTSTTAAILTETTAFDTGADGTIYVAFAFLAKNLSLAASDLAWIFSLDSASGPTIEAGVQIYSNAGTIQLRAGKNGGTMRATNLLEDHWYWIELAANIDAGGGNDGTLDFYVDGVQIGAQLTGLDQAVITQARMGLFSVTGCAGGDLFFGRCLADDTRLGLHRRYTRQQIVTKSKTVFVGPGTLSTATILSSGASDKVVLYDTDTAYSTANDGNVVTELANGINGSCGGPMVFDRGCFALISGSNPRVQIIVNRGYDLNCSVAPETLCTSDDAVMNYVARRSPLVGNV